VRRALLLVLAGLLLLATTAIAYDPQAETYNLAKSRERHQQDAASPGYQEQIALQSLDGTVGLGEALAQNPGRLPANPCAANLDLCAGDPRLYDWGGRYGVVRPIHYVNRNGALISGHLWAPLPRRGRPLHRMPTVLIVNGDLAPEQVYWWAAQVIARTGYVVMTFDPQGHGASDTYGTGDDHDRHVDIQQSAAGEVDEPAADEDAAEQTRDALRFLLSSRHHRYLPARTPGHPRPGSSPGRTKQKQLVRTRDADRRDPLRRLLTRKRIGLAGHSRGADAVSIVGSRDHRVDAIVAWDNLLAGSDSTRAPRPAAPRVPALGMSADYYEADEPYTEDPPQFDKSRGFAAYRRAGVDSMEVVVRGGTHYEWSYVPTPALGATLRGIDMAAWYSQAWFDRYLKARRSADRRLLSDRWRNDPGERAVDLQGNGNMYSFYYRSRLAIHAGPGNRLVNCHDLHSGCAALIPKRHDGYPGEYSYLSARQGG
jgi:dienelactone hydrolase